MTELLLRTLLTWVLFIPIAIVNGAMRDMYYLPKVGNLPAHQISTVIASLLYLALTYVVIGPVADSYSTAQLLGAGLIMVFMTVAFEFGFGRLLRQLPWSTLLEDYNVRKGRVWPLFLLIIFCAPYVVSLCK